MGLLLVPRRSRFSPLSPLADLPMRFGLDETEEIGGSPPGKAACFSFPPWECPECGRPIFTTVNPCGGLVPDTHHQVLEGMSECPGGTRALLGIGLWRSISPTKVITAPRASPASCTLYPTPPRLCMHSAPLVSSTRKRRSAPQSQTLCQAIDVHQRIGWQHTSIAGPFSSVLACGLVGVAPSPHSPAVQHDVSIDAARVLRL